MCMVTSCYYRVIIRYRLTNWDFGTIADYQLKRWIPLLLMCFKGLRDVGTKSLTNNLIITGSKYATQQSLLKAHDII